MTGDPVLAVEGKGLDGWDARAGSGRSRNRQVAGSLMATPFASRRPGHEFHCASVEASAR
jgi:hypothetical protein